MLIQIILIVSLLIFAVQVSKKQTQKTRAGKKIILGLFVLLCVIFIIFPDVTNVIANYLGVGRGADLVLYFLTVIFIFYIFESQSKLRSLELKINKLSRKISLMESLNRRDESS